MENEQFIPLDFIELEQPIGKFYIASIPYKDLIAICYADIREIQHEEDFETYLGIQRDLNPKRVKEIMEYVNVKDATFPTSIILSISNKKYYAEYSAFNRPVDEIFDDVMKLDENFQYVKNVF